MTRGSAARASTGAVLNRLFQTAQLAAGRVRAETHVARGAASVSSASVQLAKQIFGSLRGRRAMVLGAGEMAELALGSFASEGVQAAIVANRSFARAEEIAARHGAQAIHFDDGFWTALDDVDVLLMLDRGTGAGGRRGTPAPCGRAARRSTPVRARHRAAA